MVLKHVPSGDEDVNMNYSDHSVQFVFKHF